MKTFPNTLDFRLGRGGEGALVGHRERRAGLAIPRRVPAARRLAPERRPLWLSCDGRLQGAGAGEQQRGALHGHRVDVVACGAPGRECVTAEGAAHTVVATRWLVSVQRDARQCAKPWSCAVTPANPG